MNDLLIAAGQQKLDTVTNRVWCDDWRKSKAGAVKERSRMKYEQVARNWLDFLNGKADKPLESVSKADAIAYRDRLASDGLSPRTVNQTVKLLRGIYSEALEQGHIGRNPFAGVDRLREDAENAHRVPFTEGEVSALVKAAEGDWKGIILLAASTGLRLMDGARLKWKDLRLEATPPQLHIKTSKTGAVLDIPLHNAFVSWIESQPRGIGDAPVFPSLANKGGPGKSGLSMAFKRLTTRAGVCAQVARNGDGRGRTTSQKSFHSLRHFAATQMAKNGVRPEIARAITGHADPETHSKYITADTASLQSAVAGTKFA